MNIVTSAKEVASDEEIIHFADSLFKYTSTATVENQYSTESELGLITRTNLLRYLSIVRSHNPKVLLVGEAPGYNGCRWTGIPFTSERNIAIEYKKSQLFGAKNGFLIWNNSKPHSEASATIVWSYLADTETLPLMWNAFPFHPHQFGNKESNRRPTSDELNVGKIFLSELISIYDIRKIIAVGNTAQKILEELDLTCSKVRHPANGGKNEFVIGMNRELYNYELSL